MYPEFARGEKPTLCLRNDHLYLRVGYMVDVENNTTTKT